MLDNTASKYAVGRANAWPEAMKEGWHKDLVDFIRHKASTNLAAGRPLTVDQATIENAIPTFKEKAEWRTQSALDRLDKKGGSKTFKTKPIYVRNPATEQF